MSERGNIIRGAGAHLKRNNELGVGVGRPYGGEEGDIRVQMVDGSPKLYARAGNKWYSINLKESTLGEETILGSSNDYLSINSEEGITVISNNKNVTNLGRTLRVGEDSSSKSALRVASDGSITIGTSGTTAVTISSAGAGTFAGALTATSGTIGGWTINETLLKSDSERVVLKPGDNTIYIDSQGTGSDIKYVHLGQTWAGSYTGHYGISAVDAGHNFVFRLDGSVHTIAGWTMTNAGLYNGRTAIADTNAGVFIGQTGISLGGAGAPSFKVTSAGAVTASNVTVTGGNWSGGFSGATWNGTDLTKDEIANNTLTNALLRFGAKEWSTNLEIKGTAYNRVVWNNGSASTNATITFADGSTHTVNHGASPSNLSDNTTYFFYVVETSNDLQFSDTYTNAVNAVTDGTILVATVVVGTSTSGDAPSIFPYRSNALTISAASIAANAITATAIAAGTITADEIDTTSIRSDVVTSAAVNAHSLTANAVDFDNCSISGTLTVGNTAAKCTDANADQTSANTSADTSAVNGLASSKVSGWAHSSDTTKIDGGDIYTNTVTATQIASNTITISQLATIANIQLSGVIGVTGSTPNILIGGTLEDVGQYNIGIGTESIGAGTARTAGANYNIGIGFRAAKLLTSGDDNICIGREAGDNITTGSDNVVIGGSDVPDGSSSDQLVISSGDGGVNWINGTASGRVLINRSSVSATTKDPYLEVDGYVSFDGFIERAGINGSDNGGNVMNFNWDGSNLEGWVDTTEVQSAITSDYRVKENITNVADGVLEKINALRPIHYTQKAIDIFQESNLQRTSFLAHEFAEQFPNSVKGNKDETDSDGNNIYQKYKDEELGAYLVKAVQELSAKVTALEAKI